MIKSFFDDLAFSYYKQHGSRHPVYLGNWNDVLPDNLSELLDSFSWKDQPERNYKEISSRLNLNEPTNQEYLELAHFKKFQSIENVSWKIADYKDIINDSNFLFKKIDTILKVYKVWITQIPSGCCIPQHIDTINAFVNDFSIQKDEIKNIKRLIILPDEIKPWHHLWYGKKILTEGKKGDAWSFNFWEPHGGGNLGPDHKYTIQVMGI